MLFLLDGPRMPLCLVEHLSRDQKEISMYAKERVVYLYFSLFLNYVYFQSISEYFNLSKRTCWIIIILN